MSSASVKSPQGRVICTRYWVLRVKLPKLPTWLVPSLEIMGFILFASIASKIIGE